MTWSGSCANPKYQILNPRQTPNTKHQTPNTKQQTTNNKQQTLVRFSFSGSMARSSKIPIPDPQTPNPRSYILKPKPSSGFRPGGTRRGEAAQLSRGIQHLHQFLVNDRRNGYAAKAPLRCSGERCAHRFWRK